MLPTNNLSQMSNAFINLFLFIFSIHIGLLDLNEELDVVERSFGHIFR